jgi:hypothetical protein
MNNNITDKQFFEEIGNGMWIKDKLEINECSVKMTIKKKLTVEQKIDKAFKILEEIKQLLKKKEK